MEPILKGSTTLAILFGASEFPKIGLSAPESFRRSVDQFESYLLESLKLNPNNICNLFDTALVPIELAEQMETWVRERRARDGATALIFYYVGHGVIDKGGFCLASRATTRGYVPQSSLSSETLRTALYRAASGFNFYIILDCCYSAAAHEDFQAAPDKGATVLYTSAGAKAEAKAPANELYTRFSDALFAALSQGVSGADEYLSFSQLESEVEKIYRERYSELIRPQLSAPNAPKMNVLQQPVFPNPGYREAAKHYEYFTRWIRRRGVAEGVGPITEREAKQRRVSVRIVRENGRIRRVETVNGSGTLTPHYYNSALLGGSLEGQDSQEQECSWEFSYYENGRVALEDVRNASGHLLYRCAYSAGKEADCTARYLNPSDVSRPRAKSGAASVRIFRDERGLDRRIEFLDASDQPQPDDSGSYGREFELNGDGLEVRVVQLDRAGKPTICKEGYAIAEYESDAYGSTTSQSYFDAEEAPVLREGYHKAVMEWSPEGNWAGVKLTGVDGQPVLSKGGFASWKSFYDECGNQKRQEFFGLNGEPVVIKDGYASWEADYNEQGRVTATRFFDLAGRAGYSRDGVSQVSYRYDNSGNVIEYAYSDGEGQPAADRYNVTRRSMTVDDLGRVTAEKYLDAEGKMARNTEGIAGYEAEYDSDGNLLLITFLDLRGKHGCNNSGIARIRRSYDDRRRTLEECFLDVDDSAVEDEAGHHRVVSSYDDDSAMSSTSYFDRNGAPAFQDGYWRVQAQYDGSGNLVTREFRDDKDQPCWHAKGYAREERSYDAFSRQTRQRYFGLDGTPVMMASGYAGWDADYDERGNCTRMAYLDTGDNPVVGRPIEVTHFEKNGNYVVKFSNAAGEPVLNEDGVAERRVELDPRGNIKRTTYFGVGGNATEREGGFAGWEADYDRFDNRIEQRCLNEQGALTAQNDGTARLTWTYDSRQMKTSETHWNVHGERLTLVDQGFAGWKAAYDDRCNQIQNKVFGPDGEQLVDCSFGYARVEAAYLDRPKVVEREWFQSNGERISNMVATYGEAGRRIEASPDEIGGTLIQTFDRAGNAIRREYLLPDGKPGTQLEGSLSFARFEEDFDRYGRSTEQRYYDASGKLFRSVGRSYDPSGNETENVQRESRDGGTRTTRTLLASGGTMVDVRLSDTQGMPATDDSGRHRWVERLNAQGNRVKIEYFDIAGEPTTFRGHYWSTAQYDALGCLKEAVFSIPFDEDEIRNRRFRFGPQGSPHVRFESLGSNGARVANSAYLIEHAMKQGDQLYYLNKVESSADNSYREVTFRQTCSQVRPAGSYWIVVEIPGASDWQTVAQMVMTRTGQVLETSLPLEFSIPPFPAYPVFAGDTWQKQVVFSPNNPFTEQPMRFVLDYSYRLSEVMARKDGATVARIEVECPKTKISLGSAAAWTISASGVTLFEVEKGFLLESRVEVDMVVSVGRDEEVSHTRVTLQLCDNEPQQSFAQAT